MSKSGREQPIIIVVKKKKGGHGHHGGAWKVAFADFMTALMAMFLVLWIVTQSSDIKSAIAGYFQDPLGRADEFGSSIMPGDGTQAANVRPMAQPQVMDLRRDRLARLGEQVREKIKELGELEGISDQIEIEVTDDGLRISLMEDSVGVFFETGSAQPKGRAAELFRVIGAELAKVESGVIVEGHTDSRPYGPGARYTNWELSSDRANSARRLLLEGGLASGQLVEVRGYADRSLRLPHDPFHASNRRVTITVSGMPVDDGRLKPVSRVLGQLGSPPPAGEADPAP